MSPLETAYYIVGCTAVVVLFFVFATEPIDRFIERNRMDAEK